MMTDNEMEIIIRKSMIQMAEFELEKLLIEKSVDDMTTYEDNVRFVRDKVEAAFRQWVKNTLNSKP